MAETVEIVTKGQGLYECTEQVEALVHRSTVAEGICCVFVQHTSASLVVQENADPSARRDLEAWLNRLVKENDPLFIHTAEGPDDMPAHIKAALTATSISIPIVDGRLTLGTWQGIYLWEHRRASHRRKLIVQLLSC